MNKNNPERKATKGLYIRDLQPRDHQSFKNWCSRSKVPMTTMLKEIMRRAVDEGERFTLHGCVEAARLKCARREYARKRVRLTHEQMKTLRGSGASISEIARRAGCSRQLIYTMLEE